MSVSLVKGQKLDLTKGNSGLKKVVIGLGWDINRYNGEDAFDLDVSAFFIGSDGKVTNDGDFIFYNQPSHSSNSIIYSGDNTTGDGNGDDETFVVELAKIPSNIQKVIFTASIYDGVNRLQNFGMVDNAYIRGYNEATNEELFTCDLTEDYSLNTGLIAGELYRHNGEWKFNAVKSGCAGGLDVIARSYGVNI